MRIRVTLSVLAAVLALVAGKVTGAAAQTTDEVRIGIVSPLTGPAAKFGQAQKNAMTMAAEDVNAAGRHPVRSAGRRSSCSSATRAARPTWASRRRSG